MSRENEEILDVMWRLATVGPASFFILLLKEPRSLQYPDLNCARVARSFMVKSFSELLI